MCLPFVFVTDGVPYGRPFAVDFPKTSVWERDYTARAGTRQTRTYDVDAKVICF